MSQDPVKVFFAPVLISLALAAAMLWLAEPEYEARSRVELSGAPDSSSSGASVGSPAASALANTQVEVIKSDRVVQIAAKKLRLRSLDELKTAVSVRRLAGTRIIDIIATRPSGAEAALWANAITDAYVEFKRASAISNSVASGQLINRGIERAKGQIAALDAEIKKNPPNAAALRESHSTVTAQVSALQAQLRSLPESEAVVKGDVAILATAEVPREPVRPDPVKYMAIATGAGALVGAPLAFVPWRRRSSVRRVVKPSSQAQEDGIRLEADEANPARLQAPAFNDDFSAMSRRLEGLESRLGAELERLNEAVRSGSKFDRAFSEQLASVVAGALGQIDASNNRAHAEEAAARLMQPLDERVSQQLASLSQQVMQSVEGLTRVIGREVAQTVEQLSLGQLPKAVEGLDSRMTAQLNLTAEWLASQMAAQLAEANGGLHSSISRQLGEVTDSINATMAERLGQTLEPLSSSMTGQLSQATDSINAGMLERLQQAVHVLNSSMTDKLSRVTDELASSIGQQFAQAVEPLSSMTSAQLAASVEAFNSSASTQFSAALDALGSRLSNESRIAQESVTANMASLGEKIEAGMPAELSRLTGLSKQINLQIHSLKEHLALGFEQTRETVVERAETMQAEWSEAINRKDKESLERFSRVAQQLTQGLSQVRSEILVKMDGQLEKLGGISEDVLNSSQVTYLSERIDGMEHESFQRLGKIAVRLFQGLEDLREEMAGRVGSIQVTQEAAATQMSSVERQLEGVSGALTARLGVFTGEVGAQIKALDERFAGTVEQINEGFRDAFRLTRSDLTQQISKIDHEVAQRFERIAVRLSQALDSLRTESLENTASYQKTVAAALESLEERRAEEAKEAARRLNGVLEHFGNEIEAVEAKSARALAEMREVVFAGARSDRTDAAAKLARMEDFGTKISERVKELSARMSHELSQQVEELSGRLDSLEHKVEDEGKAVSKRISISLRSIESAVTGLTDGGNRSGANREPMRPPVTSQPPAGSSRSPKKPAK